MPIAEEIIPSIIKHVAMLDEAVRYVSGVDKFFCIQIYPAAMYAHVSVKP